MSRKNTSIQSTLALLLAMAFVLAMLPACGQTQEATSPSTESAVPAEASSSETKTAETSEVSAYPLVEDTATLTAYAPFRTENPAAVNEFDDWITIQEAEKITNVHIDWQSIPEAQYRELCPIMIASGDYADIIYSINQGYSGGITEAYADNVIIDLADIIKECAPNYCSLIDGIKNGWSQVSTDGGNILSLYSLNNSSNSQGALIRGDWLSDLGLEVPQTVEEYTNMLYAFKNAYSVAPMEFSSNSQEGLLFTSAYDVSGYQMSIFGSGSYWYNVDGKVHCSLIEDGYKQYLTLMNQYYTDGLFSKDFQSFSPASNDTSKNELISSNQIGLIGISDSQVDAYTDMISGINGAYWVVAANPVINSGDMIHFGTNDLISSGSTMASISTECTDANLALKWLDFWYSYQGINLYNYGIEGKTYTTAQDGTAIYTDLILNNEWGLGYSSAINTYCPIGNIASYGDIRRYKQYYSENTNEAINVWGTTTDLAYVLPKITLNDEESAEYNANTPDIETYAQECILSFITGNMSISTQWDEYVQKLKSMNIERNMEIYQEALDRMS